MKKKDASSLKNQTLAKDYVICWEISLFPESASAKVQVVGVCKTFHQIEFRLPPEHTLRFLNWCKEMLHDIYINNQGVISAIRIQ